MATLIIDTNSFYMAKLAYQAKRYEDSFEFMEKRIVATTSTLTVEERNILSLAYKKIVNSLRTAYRTMPDNDDDQVALVNSNYKFKVESELSGFCWRILKLLDSYLLPSASTSESKVYYLKMKGDFYRYLAEFKIGSEKEAVIESSIVAYKEAEEIALEYLAPSHPTRLGVALNFAVFYYEIQRDLDKACSIIREALDEAVVDKCCCEESTVVIMQLMRNNLAFWSSHD